MLYLKSRTYYEDLYDKHTVEYCRRLASYDTNQGLTDADFEKEGLTAEEVKELATKVVRTQWLALAKEMSVFMYAAERYNKKERCVAELMQADKAKDDFYTSANPPLNAGCRECNSTDLKVISKDLFWEDNMQNRVLFMFECRSCSAKSAYFDDGEKWIVNPVLCPVCKRDQHTYAKQEKDHILTITYTCQFCDNTWAEILDLTPLPEEKPDLNYHEDRKLYCYSEKVREWAKDMKEMGPPLKLLDEEERKKQELVKQQLDGIQKLTIAQVGKRLSTLLKGYGYTNFQLGSPDTNKGLVMQFTVIDSEADRTANQSRSNVRKLLAMELASTNWRLVRSSLEYRLGYITGRLKGYESQYELKKMLEERASKELRIN